jgi:DNA-binding winged helix-turn-helix (wHTH) protein/Tol biopolymer transport system component
VISAQNNAQSVFRFGPYELNADIPELRRDGRIVRMQRQPASVLSYLIRNSGRIVTREELQAHLWGEDTFVDFESGLNFCIRQIRTALHDNATAPVYVQTVPRVGYRFIAPVTVEGAGLTDEARPDSDVVDFAISDQAQGEAAVPVRPDSRSKLLYLTSAIALIALGVLSTVLLSHRSEQKIVAGLPLTMTKVTSTGRVLRVAISPDGQYVAYIANDGAGRSLWLKHLATGSERELVSSTPGMFGLLKFSHDGNYVYFARVDDSAHGLYRVAQLGGDPQPVLNDTPFGLGISPDGKYIAVLEKDAAGYPVKILNLADQKIMQVAFLASSDYYVDSLSTISFSSDQKSISLAVGRVKGTNSAIVTIDTQSKSQSEISLPFKAEDAVLIPKRDAFLVSTSIASENAGHLWLQSVHGGPPQPLLGASTYYPIFDVANDARTAVAISLEGFISAEVSQSKSDKRQLATLTDPFPQVRWLGTSRLAIVSETGKLQSLDSTTGEIDSTLDNFTQRVAPCSRNEIVLLRKTINEKPSLWVMDTQTSKLTRITDGEDADPKCTPDGQSVYYIHLDGTKSSLWRTSLDGKSREQIDVGGYQLQTQFDLHFDYSVSPGPGPAGKWIAIRAQQDGNGKLVLISTATHAVERALDIPQDAYDWKWKPDGRSLTFINGKDPRWSLYELSLGTGKVARLNTGNDAGIVDYDWGADGRLAILRGYRIADVVRFSL